MLFRTIVNSTKILFLYPLIQPPSPKIKIPQNSNLGGIRFGIDTDGNYGYKEVGADTVIPFKKIGIIENTSDTVSADRASRVTVTVKFDIPQKSKIVGVTSILNTNTSTGYIHSFTINDDNSVTVVLYNRSTGSVQEMAAKVTAVYI